MSQPELELEIGANTLCLKINGIISQPALGLNQTTGETGFAIMANVDARIGNDGHLDMPILLFMPKETAESLAHAVTAGHLPREGCVRS